MSNIKITKYFNFKSSFNGVFPRGSLLRTKGGEYATNLDDKQSKGRHWVSFFIDQNMGVP